MNELFTIRSTASNLENRVIFHFTSTLRVKVGVNREEEQESGKMWQQISAHSFRSWSELSILHGNTLNGEQRVLGTEVYKSALIYEANEARSQENITIQSKRQYTESKKSKQVPDSSF